MADGINLGTAWVQIVPSTKGLGASLTNQMTPQLGLAGKTAGATMGKGMLGTMGKMGSALAAVGIAGFLKDSVSKAMAAEKSWAQLSQAVDNTGISFASAEKAIRSTLSAQSELSAFSGGQLREGLLGLVQVTGDASRAQELLALTADLARAKGMDMATAAKLVGRVSMGSTSILTRYGIVLEKGATATEALAAMQKKFGGAAEAYGNSTQGSIDKANNALGKLQVQIGTALLPTMGRVAGAVSGVVNAFSSLPGPVKDIAILIGAAGTAALIAAPFISTLGKAYAWCAAQAGTASLANAGFMASLGGWGKLALLGAAAAVAFWEGFKPDAVASATYAYNALTEGYGACEDRVKSGLTTWSELAKRMDQTFEGGKKSEFAFITAADRAKILANAASSAADANGDLAESATNAAADLWTATRAMNGAKVAADTLAGKERTLTELTLASKTANLDVKDATDALTKARGESHGKRTRDVQRAEIALTNAQISAADAAAALGEAQVDAGVKVDGTKGKISDYRTELGLIPGTVDTQVTVHVNGGPIDKLIAKLKQLPGGGKNGVLRWFPGANTPVKPKKDHKAHGGFNPGVEEDITWGDDGAEAIVPLSARYRSEARAIMPKVLDAVGGVGGATFAPVITVYADSMSDKRAIGNVVRGVLNDVVREASSSMRAQGLTFR
jgi:hypothetical protein